MKIRVCHVLWAFLIILSFAAVFVSGGHFATNFAVSGNPTTRIPSIFVPFGTVAVIFAIEYGRRRAAMPFGEQVFNGLLVVYLCILLFLIAANVNHNIIRILI